jgi:hypothetical protein
LAINSAPKRRLTQEDGPKKSLQIDTRIKEGDVMEQMKSSFKVKQQQQMIIEQRNSTVLLPRNPLRRPY